MNILQVQNTLKDLSDNQLQQQLLRPNGSAPSFLVLSELQRRKDLRAGYADKQASGKSMAEEFAQGVGGADVGKYSPAMRASTNPHMSPEMDANPAQPMPGESPLQTQAYAAGGAVQGDSFVNAMLPNFFKGMQFGVQGMPGNVQLPNIPPRNRQYLGPGTPSPLGIEQLYFKMGMPAGPAADDGSTPMGVQGAMMPPPSMLGLIDGSANGATGAAGAGSVGAAVGEGASVSGGDAGTVGASVGGNAGTDAGTGDDGGGTYAEGGEIDELEMFPRVPDSLLRRALINRGGLNPLPPPTFEKDTRTMGQKFRDAMSVPQTDFMTRGIEALKNAPWDRWHEENQRMVRREHEMEAEAAKARERFFTPYPGATLGESWAADVQGRVLPGMRADVGESMNPFPPPGGGAGYAGPEPVGIDMRLSGVYPDPREAEGEPNDIVGPSEAAVAGGAAAVPGGQFGGAGGTRLDPSGAGAGGGSRGGLGPLNIGGQGLEDYLNQIRGLQKDDGFASILQGVAEDRAKLGRQRESDKGMALLAAGLGMMGGTSPHAAVNIGQGGMAGVRQWSESSKEMRQAERDLRNAENQIAVARANRDERQLEKATTLYARAQENWQRSLDRQSREGLSQADREANRELKRQELESLEKDRTERREQSRIAEWGQQAKDLEKTVAVTEAKLAAIKSDALTDPKEQAARIAAAQAELDNVRNQAAAAREMWRRANNEREIRLGNLKKVTSGAEMRKMIKEGKLKKGDRIIRPDGEIGTVD